MLVTCDNCGCNFHRAKKALNAHKRLKRRNVFCGQDCLHKWQSARFAKTRALLITKTKESTPDGMKQCGKCNQVKAIGDFGARNSKRLQSYCKTCLYGEQIQRWNKRKMKAVEYLGGKCSVCGVIGHPVIYDFHHRDPALKDFEWGKMRLRKWEIILLELSKCDLLCSNCHRLKHINATNWGFMT